MNAIQIITAAELKANPGSGHVVVNYGSVLDVTRKGVFVTATFKVTNWDLKSGTGYPMEIQETWHESHELAVFAPSSKPEPWSQVRSALATDAELRRAIEEILGDAYAYRLGEADGIDDPELEEIDHEAMARFQRLAKQLGLVID